MLGDIQGFLLTHVKKEWHCLCGYLQLKDELPLAQYIRKAFPLVFPSPDKISQIVTN